MVNPKPPSQPPALPPGSSSVQQPQVVLPSGAGPDVFADAIHRMLAPIAQAEEKKSEHQLEAHKATLSTWDKSDGRSHIRMMFGLVVGSILVLGLAGFAMYAYVHGDHELASKIVIGIFGFLAGAASGWGAKAESMSKRASLLEGGEGE